ncbi:Hypothetical_protein [Hexamita inflata]|uniref:Hypothetical_protein n=1 Tax=Hexamita inflata TaxID=28002 RepID=A0AA86NNS9_9EUKA|nr:Hypothetical protein HINF_LOCUS9845 [Hexamita inflata]
MIIGHSSLPENPKCQKCARNRACPCPTPAQLFRFKSSGTRQSDANLTIGITICTIVRVPLRSRHLQFKIIDSCIVEKWPSIKPNESLQQMNIQQKRCQQFNEQQQRYKYQIKIGRRFLNNILFCRYWADCEFFPPHAIPSHTLLYRQKSYVTTGAQ